MTNYGLALVAFTVLCLQAAKSSAGEHRPQTVVYWGQNGSGGTEDPDLSHYCSQDSGVDIVILSFLNNYGTTSLFPSGTIGSSCSIDTTGMPTGCKDLSTAISTCQENGIKVILSLGGSNGAYSLESKKDAYLISQNLWYAYGNDSCIGIPRPFGNVVVDGWDFDIEASIDQQFYSDLIQQLHWYCSLDKSRTYYVTGAPQCPIPEPNMGEIIEHSKFDYLWVQFYNNPPCSGGQTVNLSQWEEYIAHTASSSAKLFIGLPAAPLASTGSDAGAKFYIPPAELAPLINAYRDDSSFGGVMMWSAGYSDSNIVDNCTYAQQVHSILSLGHPC